jgi:GT2 family glycosyltransferase/glycosyltransferase involved in cell wall biosynthesis
MTSPPPSPSLLSPDTAGGEGLPGDVPPAGGGGAELGQAVERARYELEIATLRGRLLDAEIGAGQLSQQGIALASFAESLFDSFFWGALSRLRTVKDLLRPVRFGASALQPVQHLQRDREGGPGAWEATGEAPQFLVPCLLPAGWLRVRLRMTSGVIGPMAMHALFGRTGSAPIPLARGEVQGETDLEFFVRLQATALGVNLELPGGPARFRVEQFDVCHVPASVAAVQALGRKLALLARHRLLGRVLGRGLRTLLAGRWGDFRRKLFAGLPGPEGGQPDALEAAAPAGAVAGQPAKPLQRVADTDRRDVVYVLLSAGLCGGVRVVLEHVSRLRALGHNVTLFYLDGDPSWFPRPLSARRFARAEQLFAALTEFRGIKVATWYETAPWVAESMQPGDRGYYLVQDIEESYASNPKQAAEALQTYRLGLTPITEAAWTDRQLRERFGLSPVFVSIGVDLLRFRQRGLPRDPRLLLTQARTWSGGGEAGARLKGWDTARAAVARCHELTPGMKLATFSMEEKPAFPTGLPHEHFRLPSDDRLSELYSQGGLYLLTSTHEGFGLTAAEAMACGCPVVATRADGNEEFCLHGETALTAAPGDAEQLARHCHRVLTDPALAAELGRNGRCFIQQYTWDRVIERLDREFRSGPAPASVGVESVPAAAADASGEGARSFKPEALGRLSRGEHPDLGLAAEATADCTVVIPTVNDVRQAAQCVESCRRFASPEARLQFLVVDDGTDAPAVLEELRHSAKELDFELLLNRQNLGFSASVNHGLRHARGRFVLLCNNDIRFDRPWLGPLTAAFAADPYLGIAGALLRYPDGTIQHAGMDKAAGQLAYGHAHHREPEDHPPALRGRYVWCVTGALFALRRETLRLLGGFSTAYNLCYEDLDYCLYAWSRGVRVGYCPALTAQHHEGGTRGATPAEKKTRSLLWAEREQAGRAYFQKKWAALSHVEELRLLLPYTRPLPPLDDPVPVEAGRAARPAPSLAG